jgi:hypothetical protein
MDQNRTRFLIGIGVAAALLVLCLGVVCVGLYFLYPVYFGQPAAAGPEALYTQAAETIAAQLTQGTNATATPTGTGEPASDCGPLQHCHQSPTSHGDPASPDRGASDAHPDADPL